MSLTSTQTSNILASLHLCRWEWCRASFDAPQKLADHVLHDHLPKEIPVRRRDIPLILRAEEGTGESLGIPNLGSEEHSQSLRDHSSLPSPPTSTPPAGSPLFTQSKVLSTGADPYVPDPFDFPAPDMADEPRSFASLSSPAGSHMSLDIPPSPPFSSMVRANKRTKTGHNVSPTKPGISSRLAAPASPSSSDSPSQASVAMHLTQALSRHSSSPEPDIEEFIVTDPPEHLATAADTQSHRLHWTNSQSNPSSLPVSSFPLLSQPPSQLQSHSEIPHPHLSQIPDPHLPSQPSRDPAPSTFAVSTPPRQGWPRTARTPRTYGRRSPAPATLNEPTNGPTQNVNAIATADRGDRPPHLRDANGQHELLWGESQSQGPGPGNEDSLLFPNFYAPLLTQPPYQSQSQTDSDTTMSQV